MTGAAPAEPTYVSRRATGGGHDVSGALHLREAKVADHDLRLVLGIKIQQILWLNTNKQKKTGGESQVFREQNATPDNQTQFCLPSGLGAQCPSCAGNGRRRALV